MNTYKSFLALLAVVFLAMAVVIIVQEIEIYELKKQCVCVEK